MNNLIIPGFDDERNEQITITLKKVDSVPNCIVFELKGHVDTYNSPFFQRQVQKAINADFINLIFNANGLNYLSSTGIGCFTAFLKAVKPKDGNVVFFGMPDKVMEIFKLLGFEQFFSFSRDIEDSIRFLKAKSNKSTLFPKVFECPVCDKKLKANKGGKYRCPNCKTVLAVSDKGEIFLG
jgi:anti-sigma B factor antagonist